jgi:hypothetical protein
MAGRTVTRWIRFGVDDSAGTPREIPIHTLSPVGLTYAEEDVSAWQDLVMGFLAGHPTAAIEIAGPWSVGAAAGFAASAAKPALSGSHTILHPIISGSFQAPLGLAVMFGERGYWTTGQPVFGIVSPSSTSGYVLMSYVVEGNDYTAKFQPWPGTAPVWGTAILS